MGLKKLIAENDPDLPDSPVITDRMISAGIEAYLRFDPEDSLSERVRAVFVAMSDESQRPPCPESEFDTKVWMMMSGELLRDGVLWADVVECPLPPKS